MHVAPSFVGSMPIVGKIMKRVSIIAVVAFIVGFLMVREGQMAISMKAENREALILYGLLICLISCAWFVIHGFTAIVRSVSKKDPPVSSA